MVIATERQTTLNEACAPLFLYLTTFRRNAATSTLTLPDLQTSLTREFEKLQIRCDRDPRLQPLQNRVRYALVATADQVVLGSGWSQRTAWSMNLLETQLFGRAEGGSQFYRIVDEVLGDPSDDAAELAEVLFTCMGLGFQGELLGERRELESRRLQLFEKARLAGRLGKVMTPSAYGRNTQRDTSKLPTVGTIRMVGVAVIATAFALLAGRVATVAMTAEDRTNVQRVIEKIEDPSLSPVKFD